MSKPSKYRYDDRTGMVIPVLTFRERLTRLGARLSKVGRMLLFPFAALWGCCQRTFAALRRSGRTICALLLFPFAALWRCCPAAFATIRRCGRTICPLLFSPFTKCWRQVKQCRRDEDWLMVCVWLGIGYVLFRIYRFLALICVGLFAIYIWNPLIRAWHFLTGFTS